MFQKTDKKSKTLAFWLSILLGIVVGTRPPFGGLTPQAIRALGVFVWAVVNWATGTLDDYVVALLMAVILPLMKTVPFSTAFSVFSGSTWWMIFGAMGLGVAVERSGLLARFALKTLLALPDSFAGQCTGLLISGIAFGPTLASVTGKSAIASRFVLGMHQALGLSDQSKHSTGLFMSMYLGFVLSAPLYMTASVCSFIVWGLIPQDMKSGITWGSWLLASLPLVGMMVLSVFVYILKCYDPGKGFDTTKTSLRKQLDSLGKPHRNEVLTGLVLLATLLAWVTEPFHHIDTAIPALLGVLVLASQGVLERKSFDQLPWSTLIFLGVVLNLGSVFPQLGIDAWAKNTLGPALLPVARSPVLFLMAIALLTVGLRFVVVSYNALTSIMMVSLLPLSRAIGIHPLILGQVLHVVGQAVFLMPYQNPIYVIAHQGAEGRLSTHRDARNISLVALFGCLLGIAVGTTVWVRMGLIQGKGW